MKSKSYWNAKAASEIANKPRTTLWEYSLIYFANGERKIGFYHETALYRPVRALVADAAARKYGVKKVYALRLIAKEDGREF